MTARKRNHQWLLIAIAIPAAVEVWACWVGLGSLCGFPVIGGESTDWTLAIGMEAYGAYALFVWLGAAPGLRSRKFAQWSALGAFALSLIGQVAYHIMLADKIKRAPVGVIVFVACLLVVILAFAAILTHLMHSDARAAVNTAEETVLRESLAGERSARLQAEAERDAARQEAANVTAKAATFLERELAAFRQRTGNGNAGGAGSSGGAGNGTRKRVTAPDDTDEEEAPSDLDSEARVLWYLDRGYSASKAGVKAGLTDGRGRQIARLRRPAPKGIDEGGRS
jgi:hypothetical protein